jgi:hypothetical protein
MILYLKAPQKTPPPPKLLDIIDTFSKVAGYKISKQKSVAFPYTNNEQTEKKPRKKKIPLTIASKR